MAEPVPVRAPIRFGVFELDARAGELRKAGTKLKLEGQPLAVLAILLEHPGQVVTREELQARLWPGGTFVDFEQGINAAVKRLRQALDDSAETPRFIETLPRRGHRFIYPVGSPELPKVAPANRRRWTLAAVAAVIVVLSAALTRNTWQARVYGHARPALRSVVVLPLENQTGDPAKEYLARGFADDLTHEISRVEAWDVVWFESTPPSTGKVPAEVARALGKDACLAGTIQQDGERLRVNLRLVYASNSSELLWSYWPTPEEMPALPRRAALEILQHASVAVAPEVQARLRRQSRVDPQAYTAYSIGRNAYWSTITEEGHRKSIEYYEQAIAADPNFAQAYSAMARSFLFLHQLHRGAGFKDKARAAALKAIELDSELAEPHAMLGNIKRQDGDTSGAEAEYRLALRLDPSDALVHSSYSIFLDQISREADQPEKREALLEQALQEGLRAEQLDPQSAYIASAVVLRLHALGRCQEAVTQGRKAQQLDPDLWMAHSFTAGALWDCGRRDEAVAEWEKALALPGVYERWILSQLVVAYAELGRKAEAQKAFAQLRRLPDVEPDRLAAAYAAMGRKEEAIRILRAAPRVQLDSRPLRLALGEEPAYQALLRERAKARAPRKP